MRTTDHTWSGFSFYDYLWCFGISLLVIVGTFPDPEWAYSVGIDPPLAWVYSHLFETGSENGQHIIFPHGPLAFFMYPVGDNVILVTTVLSLLKALIVLNIFWLLSGVNSSAKWLFIAIPAYLISMVAEFNHLSLTVIVLFYCNYYHAPKTIYKLSAFLLTAFVFYVKAYVAIVSGTLFVSFVLYYFFTTRNVKSFLTDPFILLGFILSFWLLIFGSIKGFPDYLWGMMHLAQDNSSAAAYYPYNNWWILSCFFILVFVLFRINRTPRAVFFWSLTTLSLFAAWKHGMAREDIYHVYGFYLYFLTCLIIFILFTQKRLFSVFLLSGAAVWIFSLNMKHAVNYTAYEYKLFKGENFIGFLFQFDSLRQRLEAQTQKDIAVHRLSQALLDSISTSTVDIYPWDYSIIAANHLNWKPRVVLHSYASYTSWLDIQNARHFSSPEAPDYLIIEKVRWANLNNGMYSSIDSRYFLNDEPQTLLSILKNYTPYSHEKNLLILKKRLFPQPVTVTETENQRAEWNQWIPVPSSGGELLRAKLDYSSSFLQRIKSFLYKDEQFWIYLKLKNNSIHKYRIVLKNAQDGLWINPYIFRPDKKYEVTEIMLKGSNQKILSSNFSLQWERIRFPETPELASLFFMNQQSLHDSLLYSSVHHFESAEFPQWTRITSGQVTPEPLEGLNAHVLKPGAYSATFSLPLDSLPLQTLNITTDCWLKSSGYNQAKDVSLIISIEKQHENIQWKAASVREQIIDPNYWNNIYNFLEYDHQEPGCTLTVYIWNTSDHDMLIDNFRVMIFNPTIP